MLKCLLVFYFTFWYTKIGTIKERKTHNYIVFPTVDTRFSICPRFTISAMPDPTILIKKVGKH